MGFLQHLFSRGESKRQQNGHATDEDGMAPKTRRSLSVINALADRDHRKAHSSTRPSTDGPLDEDLSLTRLLRTNSTNFRVINEIDYKSFPQLAHPITEFSAQPWLHNGESEPLDERTGQSVLCAWIHNPEPRVYICQVPLDASGRYCEAQYQRQDRALTHVRTHLNYKPFACRGRCGMKDCPDAFTSEAYLKVHIQPVRKECEKCGQSYLRQNIKRHAAHCK